MSYSSINHWTIFQQHHEATRASEKKAWEDILITRKQNIGMDENTPIVIWGFEASPSIWKGCEVDITVSCNKEDYIHKNYFFSEKDQDQNSYRYQLIKKHINKDFQGNSITREQFINALSGKYKLSGNNFSWASTPLENPVHLVHDIFHEWHGLDVTDRMRKSVTTNMQEKAKELKDMLKESGILKNPIHFIWCASGYANLCNKNEERKQAKCNAYFEKLKNCFPEKKTSLNLYHKPYGFFKDDLIEKWSDLLNCFNSCGCSCRKKPDLIVATL